MATPEERKKDHPEGSADKPVQQPTLSDIDAELEKREAEQTLDNPAAGV
jgi:hypothetical protein